jgi:hypothetical protein
MVREQGNLDKKAHRILADAPNKMAGLLDDGLTAQLDACLKGR